MRFIIDRFEDKWAIVELEDGNMIDVPIGIIPIHAKEGDVLKISVDKRETLVRKKRIEEKFRNLFED